MIAIICNYSCDAKIYTIEYTGIILFSPFRVYDKSEFGIGDPYYQNAVDDIFLPLKKNVNLIKNLYLIVKSI